MSRKSDLFSLLTIQAVIGVVREEDPQTALSVARACADGGIGIIEITMTTPDAVGVLSLLSEEWRDRGIVLAAGTLRSSDDAARARRAGASILVSPHLDLRVIDYALENDLLVLSGAATPTEIIQAWERGADAVKVYPAVHLGGPAYIRTIRQPIRDVPMVAGGPVPLDTIADYLDAGAIAVNLGASLALPELVAAGDWTAITRRAAHALSIVAASHERETAAEWPVH